MSVTSDQLFAIAILIDELKHEEMSHRLGSMQHLKEIADALGPERTRTELLPFLVNASLDDEDEVLLAMAEELGGFTKQVGGAAHAAVLVAPLEALANVEEPAVREKAVQGLVTVSGEMGDGQVQEVFVPLLRALANKDWFTSRITACGLIPAVFSRLSAAPSRAELKQMFVELGKDDTPMVRKALCSTMPKFVEVVDADMVKADLVPLFNTLATDEHDSVRLFVCPVGVAISKRLGAGSNSAPVTQTCVTLAQDKGWRVRWSVASVFNELLAACGAPSEGMLEAFSGLLRDAEPEVRTAATAKLTKVAKLLPQAQVLSTFLPLIVDLSSDQSEHVREALGLVVLGLGPVVGKAETVKSLLPTFLTLLGDTNPQVRLGMVSQLGSLENVIGIDELSSALLPAVIELAHDKNWRVRAQTISHLPVLAKQMDKAYFENNLLELCVRFLSDPVYSIREAASVTLMTEICGVFGAEWTMEKIVPRILELKANKNYLYRMTAIRSAEVLVPVLDAEFARGTLLPFILSLGADPVPNVRFGVAKALMRGKLGSNGEARTCLDTMINDKDADVVYFAKKALEAV